MSSYRLVKAARRRQISLDKRNKGGTYEPLIGRGDWDPYKAHFGLIEIVAPGTDLSFNAGIGWLLYKTYGRSILPNNFKGWFVGVADYNHRGNVAYGMSVFGHLAVLKQAEQDAEDQ